MSQYFYEIIVEGQLPHDWQNWLMAQTITHQRDGNTRLLLEFTDNAALYGLIARLRDLGLVLVSLQRCSSITADGG